MIQSAQYANEEQTQVRVTYSNGVTSSVPVEQGNSQYYELIKWEEQGNSVIPFPKEGPKVVKAEQISAERYKREISGVRINGNLYATDDRSKILIPGVADLADNSEDIDAVRPFKTADSNGVAVYHNLPVWEALQVKRIGGEYIQKCFDEERRLLQGLENGEDLTPNWPKREYTITREEAVAKRLTRAEIQKRVRALENKATINYEVLTGVTGSNGSVTLQYSQPLEELIDAVPKLSWAGNQAVVPYIKEQTSTSVTLGAKQSRSSLVLSSGPFQEAPTGTEVSIAIIGKL